MAAQFTEPKGWHDITLRQYLDITDCRTKLLSEYGKAVAILAVACKTSQAAIKQIHKDEFMSLLERLNWLFMQAPASEASNQFTLDGELYQVPQDIGRRTIGEYADMDTILLQHEANKLHAISSMIAIYCRKPNEPMFTDAKDLEDRARLFEAMPVTDAMGLAAFFLTKNQQSKTNLLLCTFRKAELIAQTSTWLHSRSRTGGLLRFTRLPMTICLRWIRSRAAHAGRSSRGSSFKALKTKLAGLTWKRKNRNRIKV